MRGDESSRPAVGMGSGELEDKGEDDEARFAELDETDEMVPAAGGKTDELVMLDEEMGT